MPGRGKPRRIDDLPLVLGTPRYPSVSTAAAEGLPWLLRPMEKRGIHNLSTAWLVWIHTRMKNFRPVLWALPMLGALALLAWGQASVPLRSLPFSPAPKVSATLCVRAQIPRTVDGQDVKASVEAENCCGSWPWPDVSLE